MRALLTGVVLGALVLAAPAGAATNPTRAAADQTFVKKAAGGGIGEVELGRLAVERASNPEVKQFGQRMIEDHTKANDQLKATLSQAGVTVPTAIDPDAKKAYDRLSKLSGPQFDRAYMQDMVKDHRVDVKLFQDEAQHGKDPALKQFAQQTLPTLEEHLRMAERLAKNTVAQR